MDNHEPEVKDLIFESYMAAIKNSLGAHTWRQYFATVDGQRQEVTRDGQLSSAYFVTSILRMFDLIKEVHLTVAKTERDLVDMGWVQIDEPRPGAVLVYEAQPFGDERHSHIGFCLDGQRAISHSTVERVPVEHNLGQGSDGRPRAITARYWQAKLEA